MARELKHHESKIHDPRLSVDWQSTSCCEPGQLQHASDWDANAAQQIEDGLSGHMGGRRLPDSRVPSYGLPAAVAERPQSICGHWPL